MTGVQTAIHDVDTAQMCVKTVSTPIGELRVLTTDEGVIGIDWIRKGDAREEDSSVEEAIHDDYLGRLNGPVRPNQRREIVLAKPEVLTTLDSFSEGAPWDAEGRDTTQSVESPSACRAAKDWAEQAGFELGRYFEGQLRHFTVPLVLVGTAFQISVWKMLLKIPYGQTRSYREVATAIGNPRAVRAVGQANRANPIMILVPCHRVIGQNGSLVGYAGTQTDAKAVLLGIEQELIPTCLPNQSVLETH